MDNEEKLYTLTVVMIFLVFIVSIAWGFGVEEARSECHAKGRVLNIETAYIDGKCMMAKDGQLVEVD